MSGSRSVITSVVALGILAIATSSSAQVSASTGAIRGVVRDATGASIEGAAISLSNATSSIQREVISQPDGSFSFPLLPPAPGYLLVVDKTGFAKAVLTDVEVRVSETTVLAQTLEVGGLTEDVTVTSRAQAVQTTNATLGGVVGAKVITSIPLATRNVFDLMATDAGVYAGLTSPNATILQGSNAIYVAGQRATSNAYYWNGINATNVEFHTLAAGAVPIPSPDAVQEFKAQTSAYDASSGYSPGGTINLVTRAGTNVLHGSIYDFFRDDVFNANDFFLNLNGTDKPILKQNQFGGSIGGPVPALSETFFFVNFEGTRQRNGVTGSAFGNQPVLPASRDAASLAAAFGLPVSALDPVAVRLLNAPGPYDGYLVPSGQGAPVGTLGTYATSNPVTLRSNQLSARVDRDLVRGASNNHLAVSGFWADQSFFNPGNSGTSLGQAYEYPLGNWDLAVNDTHVFKSGVVNELVTGFNWNQRDIMPGGVSTTLDDIGMYRSNLVNNALLPTISFQGAMSCCGYSANVNRLQRTWNVTLRDTVSWAREKHSFRLGFEILREIFTQTGVQQSAQGTLAFQVGTANALYGESPLGTAGNVALRDFLIGAPSSFSSVSGIRGTSLRAQNYSAFFQDDWRLTPKLTLNLGVRYDRYGNPTEKDDHMANFDPSLLSAETLAIGGPGLRDGFVIPGENGASRTTMAIANYGNLSPRLSAAYDVLGDGRLAVRGGFGLYYQSANNMQSPLVQNPPFFSVASDANQTAAGRLASPFSAQPDPGQFPVWPAFPTLTGVNVNGSPRYDAPLITIYAIDRHAKTPYARNWNFTVEGEVLPGWTLQVGYLGTQGRRQSAVLNYNNALLINDENPGRFGLTTNSSANRETRVPIAGISTTGLRYQVNQSKSAYHALLLTLSHPLRDSFFFKSAYTFSRSWNDSPASPSTGTGGQGQLGNQFSFDQNWGISEQDIPHRLVLTYVWDLPGTRNKVLNAVIGNWTLSGISTYQSGLPGTITQSIGATSLTGTAGYGAIVPGCDLVTSGSVRNRLGSYLNPACVTTQPLLPAGTVLTGLNPDGTPGTGTYVIGAGGGRLIGEQTRGAFRAPFQQRWDLALAKAFPLEALGPSSRVELRIEAFKLFNNTIFSGPNSTAGVAGFGQITSTIDNTGRQLQFALKFHF